MELTTEMNNQLIQINISLAQKTNQGIDDLFWEPIKKIFAEDPCPDIYLNAPDADFNPEGLVHLRKQILILGQLQQVGRRMVH